MFWSPIIISDCELATGTWLLNIKYEKIRLQNTGIYRINNTQALGSTLASLGRHSPGPLNYKFCKSLCFEVQLLFRIVN